MRTEYDVIFPRKGRLTFDGGLNTKFARSLIQDNESPSCFNVLFSNGAVETRGGISKATSSAIGSFVIDGLYTRRSNAGAETMVAFAGGSAWQYDGVATFSTIGSAQSVFTGGVRVGTAQYENYLFVGNGNVTPYKYDGTYWTRHGVPQASSSGMTGALSGGGSLTTGSYYFKVAFVNSAAVFGNVSTATTAFTINSATGAINLTGIPVAPTSHGVISRRIYQASAVAGTYNLIKTINDNTTTATSVVGSETLSTAAPSDNGEPPNYSVVAYHMNRLFVNDAANPNFLWYSELFAPYTFKSTNFLGIGDASFDLIKGIDVYNNAIAVRCETSVYMIFMPSTDPTLWVVAKTRSPFGSRSPFGAFLYNNKMGFPSHQNGKFVGFAALHGNAIDPQATVLDNAIAGSLTISERIEPDMFTVVEAYQANISSYVFKNKAYIAVTYDAGATTNNRVYVFDFSKTDLKAQQEAAWVALSGVNAAQFTSYNGMLYYGSSTANGQVYQLLNGTYSDVSAAINSYYWTKEYSGNVGEENLEKDFRWLWVLVENLGAYYMNVTFRTNSDTGTGTTEQISIDPKSTLWGTMRWGIDPWGSGNTQTEYTIPVGLSGKRIQVQFSNQNTAGQGFKVHAMRINYNIKGKR